MRKIAFMGTILAMLAFQGVAWGIMGLFEGAKELKPADGVVKIPVADVSDGKAHYYKVTDSGAVIEFFVLKSPDGTIRSAFNACDVCYPAKKGYSQQGEFMICNNCGQKFHANRVAEVKGGCNPGPLPRVVEGDTLVIQLKDIQTGARYFKDGPK